MLHRVLSVNAGGKLFQTKAQTLFRYPSTLFAAQFQEALTQRSDALRPAPSAKRNAPTKKKGVNKRVAMEEALSGGEVVNDFAPVLHGESGELFVDVDPSVFELILNFLRSGVMTLPTNNEPLRAAVIDYLTTTGLIEVAFPSKAVSDGGGGGVVAEGDQDDEVSLPDICVVQACDHMQHDQGVKRHAITISYGADGFQLRTLAKRIRRDLNSQLASTYWQVYQTNERGVFFVTTKVANGTADLMTTSITQQIVMHTESRGYHLTSSYVTLSPDVVHTNVRMLIHNFVFRRIRGSSVERRDFDNGAAEEDKDPEELEKLVHPNFEPKAVGPKKDMWGEAPTIVPQGERAENIWKK